MRGGTAIRPRPGPGPRGASGTNAHGRSPFVGRPAIPEIGARRRRLSKRSMACWELSRSSPYGPPSTAEYKPQRSAGTGRHGCLSHRRLRPFRPSPATAGHVPKLQRRGMRRAGAPRKVYRIIPAPRAPNHRRQRLRCPQGGGATLARADAGEGQTHLLLNTALATTREGDRAGEPYRGRQNCRCRARARPSHRRGAARSRGKPHPPGPARRRQPPGDSGAASNPPPPPCTRQPRRLDHRPARLQPRLPGAHLPSPSHSPSATLAAARFSAAPLSLTRTRREIAPRPRREIHLGLRAARIDTTLGPPGSTAGKPWRARTKLACLAAWVALARQSEQRSFHLSPHISL